MMNKKLVFLSCCSAVLALLLLSACGSSRKAAKSGEYPIENTGEVITADPKAEFRTLADSYSPWTDVSVPVRVSMTQPSKFSCSGVLKMRNGKDISISMRMFGFEVASLYADTDSVIVCVKAMDMYFRESIAGLSDKYGITLADIQSLLLGQAFVPGKGAVTDKDISRFDIGDMQKTGFSFVPKDMPVGLEWSYTVLSAQGAVPRLVCMSIEPRGLMPVDCVFGQTSSTPAGVVASSLEFATQVKTRNVEAAVSTSMDRADWNGGVNISKPKIPRKARRVTGDDIFKMLKSL